MTPLSYGTLALLISAAALAPLRALADPVGADAAAAARQAPERCASVVFADCNGAASQAARAPEAAQRPETVVKANSKMRSRRLLVAGSGEDAAEDSGSVVVTAERPVYPQEEQWKRFGESVQAAAVPDCYSVGSSMGLLAVPIVPLMLASGHCR